MDPTALKSLVCERAEKAYHEKEVEFPVMAGLYHFTTRDANGHKRYDREKLADWAKQRFGVELSVEDLKNKQRHEIRALLVEQSHLASEQAQKVLDDGQRMEGADRQVDRARRSHQRPPPGPERLAQRRAALRAAGRRDGP